MTMTWCSVCKEQVHLDDEVEIECVNLDCPIVALRVVDVGDELHQILGAALAETNGERK
jgi:hypothetical protein